VSVQRATLPACVRLVGAVKSTFSSGSCSDEKAPAHIDRVWLQFSFPTYWHYDVLRALDYFRSVGDTRMHESRDPSLCCDRSEQRDGTWLSENTHPGKVHFRLEDRDGQPSR
jgi:hypothetical protein